MAPHDYRRLLLAHRDPGPARIPAGHATEPSATPRAGDAVLKPAASRAASPADQPEPGGSPSVRVSR